MRTLLLMRHAKSSWTDADVSDHDRCLNPRGQRDGPKMAGWLREIGKVPELVLCSTARRARETFDLVNAELGGELPVQYHESLYLAPPDQLSTAVSAAPDAGVVLVIAHNPGLEDFVAEWVGHQERMPTAAVAVLDLDLDDWAQLDASEAVAWQVGRPRELFG